MGAFQFRLQKVLELRDWREKEEAVAVERARTDAERAFEALELLRSIRHETREHLQRAHGKGGRAGEMGNLRFVLDRLDDQIAAAAATHSHASERLDSSLEALLEAVLEKQSLERLRAKQRHLSNVANAARERKETDEIASLRQTVQAAWGGAR